MRFPFLKTALPRLNNPWHDSMADLSDFIERHTAYPYSLIESNVDSSDLEVAHGPNKQLRPPGGDPGVSGDVHPEWVTALL